MILARRVVSEPSRLRAFRNEIRGKKKKKRRRVDIRIKMTSARASLGMMLLLGDYAPRNLYAVPPFSCSAESSVPFGADGHESHVTLILEI